MTRSQESKIVCNIKLNESIMTTSTLNSNDTIISKSTTQQIS